MAGDVDGRWRVERRGDLIGYQVVADISGNCGEFGIVQRLHGAKTGHQRLQAADVIQYHSRAAGAVELIARRRGGMAGIAGGCPQCGTVGGRRRHHYRAGGWSHAGGIGSGDRAGIRYAIDHIGYHQRRPRPACSAGDLTACCTCRGETERGATIARRRREIYGDLLVRTRCDADNRCSGNNSINCYALRHLGRSRVVRVAGLVGGDGTEPGRERSDIVAGHDADRWCRRRAVDDGQA